MKLSSALVCEYDETFAVTFIRILLKCRPETKNDIAYRLLNNSNGWL